MGREGKEKRGERWLTGVVIMRGGEVGVMVGEGRGLWSRWERRGERKGKGVVVNWGSRGLWIC